MSQAATKFGFTGKKEVVKVNPRCNPCSLSSWPLSTWHGLQTQERVDVTNDGTVISLFCVQDELNGLIKDEFENMRFPFH